MVATTGDVIARNVIACAGLHSDRVAAMTGDAGSERIVPFRGDYYTLRPSARHLVRGLIYPVPDPRFPFLGVHFTKRIDGDVLAGPNAVLAFAREGYRRLDFSPRISPRRLAFPGFRKLARSYFRTGLAEMWRDWSRNGHSRRAWRDSFRRSAGTISFSAPPECARNRCPPTEGSWTIFRSERVATSSTSATPPPPPRRPRSRSAGELAEMAAGRFGWDS